MHEAGRQPPVHDGLELLCIVDQPAPRTAHRVGRPDYDREPDPFDDPLGLLKALGDLAFRHLDPQTVHRLLECEPVFTPLDRLDVHTDDLDAEFLQRAVGIELRREVETRLSTQVREQRIRAFLLDNLPQSLGIQGLDIGHVRHAWIGHDRGGIRIHQQDLIAQAPQGLARLCARVVELAGLADHDRP